MASFTFMLVIYYLEWLDLLLDDLSDRHIVGLPIGY